MKITETKYVAVVQIREREETGNGWGLQVKYHVKAEAGEIVIAQMIDEEDKLENFDGDKDSQEYLDLLLKDLLSLKMIFQSGETMDLDFEDFGRFVAEGSLKQIV